MKQTKAIIVGNGPSALEKNLGSRIDSNEFDAVFRINRWAYDEDGSSFKSYPEQVGTRCDYWVVNDLHLTETQLALKYGHQYRGVFVIAPKFKWQHIDKVVTQLKPDYPFLEMVGYQYEDAVNQIVDYSPKWPTTGTISITLALQHFDEVYIHGFDAYDPKYEGMHYFEGPEALYGRNKYRDGSKADHAPSKDKQYIKYLTENYNVKYL